uniref:Uncharacterized protein n=1 Tax=Rhizophora mucronata TaxID=61149 RepID=A0A2P2NHE4_RHIMU
MLFQIFNYFDADHQLKAVLLISYSYRRGSTNIERQWHKNLEEKLKLCIPYPNLSQ